MKDEQKQGVNGSGYSPPNATPQNPGRIDPRFDAPSFRPRKALGAGFVWVRPHLGKLSNERREPRREPATEYRTNGGRGYTAGRNALASVARALGEPDAKPRRNATVAYARQYGDPYSFDAFKAPTAERVARMQAHKEALKAQAAEFLRSTQEELNQGNQCDSLQRKGRR